MSSQTLHLANSGTGSVVTKTEALAAALAAGADLKDIQQESRLCKRMSKVVLKNMIKALQLHPWNNTKADWTRLAGAMHA